MVIVALLFCAVVEFASELLFALFVESAPLPVFEALESDLPEVTGPLEKSGRTIFPSKFP